MNSAVMDETIQILGKRPHARSASDLVKLQALTSDNAFFQKIIEENGDEIHTSCCKVMKAQNFSVGENVFLYGDEGNSFCIILKGQVSVNIPKIVHKYNTLNRMNSLDDEKYEEQEFMQVSVLGPGNFFGETSLTTGMPRNATVIWTKNTWIALIDKTDYNRILAQLDEDKKNTKLQFLKGIPIFKNWSKIALNRIQYDFNLVKFRKKNIIYSEGDQATKVYFIKSGSIRFLKLVKQEKKLKGRQKKNQLAIHQPSSLTKTLQLHIKGYQQIFGDTDVMEKRPRTETAIVDSLTADWYWIEAEFFLKRCHNFGTQGMLVHKHKIETAWKKRRMTALKNTEKVKKRLMPDTSLPRRKVSISPTVNYRKSVSMNRPFTAKQPPRSPRSPTVITKLSPRTSRPTTQIEIRQPEIRQSAPKSVTHRALTPQNRNKGRFMDSRLSVSRRKYDPVPFFFESATQSIEHRYKRRKERSLILERKHLHMSPPPSSKNKAKSVCASGNLSTKSPAASAAVTASFFLTS